MKRNQQMQEDRRQTFGNSARNREFAVVTYLFLTIFLGMIAYFAYFQIQQSEVFINSPYNARQDVFAKRTIRGNIVSAQGDVLAQTVAAPDGTEVRNYPYGSMFAHVIGYSTKGRTGIEALDNFQLLRSHAFFLEKIIKEVREQKNTGDTVVTTLDLAVQKAAFDALGSRQGAVVALQPSTGKLLAMVSKPDYDPNTIAENWESLTAGENASSVLLNRAVQGLYPPGSAFKIFTMLAYMQQYKDQETYQYLCSGSLEKEGSAIHCFNNTVHGQEDMSASFANSCNTSFANIGLSLDLDKFKKLNEELLFNTSLPSDFPCERSSFVLEKGASNSEIMQTAIGQGKTLVTPYHMALVMSAIANKGMLMKPYAVSGVTNYSGVQVSKKEPEEYKRLLKAKQAARLRKYLQAVVTEGTAGALNGQGYTVGGKTGSAEYTQEKDSHAWFVGYAQKENAESIVVSVVVEGAGSGSEYAVPVAKAVFDAYYRTGERS